MYDMRHVSGPKVMVLFSVILNGMKHKNFEVYGFHAGANTGPFIFSLCFFFKTQFFIFIAFCHSYNTEAPSQLKIYCYYHCSRSK